MNSRKDRYAQMQHKLEEGLRILESTIEEDDQFVLNAALIKLHGAMEDFVRLEVGEKAPHLRDVVEDARQTSWKHLLEYGRTHLNFSQKDCDIINEANFHRQKVAHGGNYEEKLTDLKKYARFVEKWIKRARVPEEDSWVGPQVIDSQPAVQPEKQPEYRPAYEPAPSPIRKSQPDDSNAPSKPWYRSTLFLFFAFFFLTPVWILLIITDRRQGCLPKLVAYSMIVMICAGVLLFVPYTQTALETAQELFEQSGLQPPPTDTPPAVQSQPATASPPTEDTAGTSTTCTIVWVEYTAQDLGGKSRSMVWEEIVSLRVQDSGMTPSQFYDLVVEHNPELVTDGYEFKKGKTYVLPQCG